MASQKVSVPDPQTDLHPFTSILELLRVSSREKAAAEVREDATDVLAIAAAKASTEDERKEFLRSDGVQKLVEIAKTETLKLKKEAKEEKHTHELPRQEGKPSSLLQRLLGKMQEGHEKQTAHRGLPRFRMPETKGRRGRFLLETTVPDSALRTIIRREDPTIPQLTLAQQAACGIANVALCNDSKLLTKLVSPSCLSSIASLLEIENLHVRHLAASALRNLSRVDLRIPFDEQDSAFMSEIEGYSKTEEERSQERSWFSGEERRKTEWERLYEYIPSLRKQSMPTFIDVHEAMGAAGVPLALLNLLKGVPGSQPITAGASRKYVDTLAAFFSIRAEALLALGNLCYNKKNRKLLEDHGFTLVKYDWNYAGLRLFLRSLQVLTNVRRRFPPPRVEEWKQMMVTDRSPAHDYPDSETNNTTEDDVNEKRESLDEARKRIGFAAQRSLAILGHTDHIHELRGGNERGVRILCLDGGGTRALISLEILKAIEKETNQSIHELFDFICGTSTGGILAFMIGVNHYSLSDVQNLYEKLSSEVFVNSSMLSTPKMLFTRSYYSPKTLEDFMKTLVGQEILIDTAGFAKSNRAMVVSTLVSGKEPDTFVFRNYRHPEGRTSRYPGSSHHRLYQALRASTAAPTFFPEFKSFDSHLTDAGLQYPEGLADLDTMSASNSAPGDFAGEDELRSQRKRYCFNPTLQVFQDGGVLMNNPTAVALHEVKRIWPGKPIDCVVSVGTGLFHHPHGLSGSFGWTDILRTIISSATNTEGVHQALQDLLPEKTYYRFNPVISEVPLDEIRPDVLRSLQRAAATYMEKDSVKANLRRLRQQLTVTAQKNGFFRRAFLSRL